MHFNISVNSFKLNEWLMILVPVFFRQSIKEFLSLFVFYCIKIDAPCPIEYNLRFFMFQTFPSTACLLVFFLSKISNRRIRVYLTGLWIKQLQITDLLNPTQFILNSIFIVISSIPAFSREISISLHPLRMNDGLVKTRVVLVLHETLIKAIWRDACTSDNSNGRYVSNIFGAKLDSGLNSFMVVVW